MRAAIQIGSISRFLCRTSVAKTITPYGSAKVGNLLDTHYGSQSFDDVVRGKVFYSNDNSGDRAAYQRTYSANDYETPNMRMKAYRRQALQNRTNLEFEEEANLIDLSPEKLLKKGDPGTLQGIIKDVIPVGYFVTLPNGRDGYLPATELGITGGLALLERLFKVGQEITVRITERGGGGREILDIKPETYIIKKPTLAGFLAKARESGNYR